MVSMSVSPFGGINDAVAPLIAPRQLWYLCDSFWLSCRSPPTRPRLRQLQYAVAVADARSFRRAAEQCGVSQPSLSAQLAQLEGALGVRLFERDRRRVLLTPAGEELIERARRVLVDADDLVDAARRLGDPLAGTLAIGVIPTISPYLLPAAAPAIRRAHPRLTVRWREDKTENLARDLHAGRLDAALLALEADLGGPLQREVIGRDPFVLATPRAHPLAKKARARRPWPSCAARTCCCSTTVTACAIRRWRSARARAPRSWRSARPACRRWRRWCPPAPA